MTSDDELVSLASAFPFDVYRGDTLNVLARMLLAVDDHPECDVVLRITGDDILVDPEYLEKTVQCHLDHNADYTSAKDLPGGTEVEAFNADTLKLIDQLMYDGTGTEYLTNYVVENRDQFALATLDVAERHRGSLRLTLDTEADFTVIAALLAHLQAKGRSYDYTMDDIFDFFDEHPKLARLNAASHGSSMPGEFHTELDWSRWRSLNTLSSDDAKNTGP